MSCRPFKRIRKRAFSAVKQILPDNIVSAIQRVRIEHALPMLSRPGSYRPRHTYTVVSAVYNVEEYLNDYFNSLFRQTIDPSFVSIVVVDDGSTDRSAEIIDSWAKLHPDRIRYIRKPNGGQASARNVGLQFADSEWVTFIDPDDFISDTYFEEVDKSIESNPEVKLVSCNTVFYRESTSRYSDSHPLKYRYLHDSFFAFDDPHQFIQLSSSSSFFLKEEIDRSSILFDELLVPNFEDALFLNQYLIRLTAGVVAFLSRPKYYYRKRSDKSSTLDRSWSSPARFLVVPKRGYMKLLDEASISNGGFVPYNIQKTILYDLSWYLKYLIGHSERTFFLSIEEKATFLKSVETIFNYISPSVITQKDHPCLDLETISILRESLKPTVRSKTIVELKQVDLNNGLLLFSYIGGPLTFFIEEQISAPINSKAAEIRFVDKNLCDRHLEWIAYQDVENQIRVESDCLNEVTFRVRGKTTPNPTTIRCLLQCFTRGWGKYRQNKNLWIVMDRDTQADDNGEHFYRFLRASHPEINCYFALRKDSPDWERLNKEGFKLLDFGSKRHERKLRRCEAIISSHADGFVHSYFSDNFLGSKAFVFLQHGVIKDDLSAWLNPKPISKLITSTMSEYLSIVQDGSQYCLTKRQVALTGLPRHDRLLSISAKSKPNSILVMPTWRNNLVEPKGHGGKRGFNSGFVRSSYRKRWEEFLNDPRLKQLSSETGYSVIFFPHANIEPYLDAGFFSIPDYIVLAGNRRGSSIQHCFAQAKALVTDYSSAAFDMAYLGRMCFYYQFDQMEFFSGSQVYSKGYFDYTNDGFGPVATNRADLFEQLSTSARNDFLPSDVYAERMRTTFPFRDGKCCERVYRAIVEDSSKNLMGQEGN